MENNPASAGWSCFRMWRVYRFRSFGYTPVASDLCRSVKRLVSLLVIHIHENCEKCHIPSEVPFEWKRRSLRMRESLSYKKGQREKFRRRHEGRSLQTSSAEGKRTGFNEYCVNFAPKTETICVLFRKRSRTSQTREWKIRSKERIQRDKNSR